MKLLIPFPWQRLLAAFSSQGAWEWVGSGGSSARLQFLVLSSAVRGADGEETVVKAGVPLCPAALSCLHVADGCSGMGVGWEPLMEGRHRACQSFHAGASGTLVR